MLRPFGEKDTRGQAILKLSCLRYLLAQNCPSSGRFDDFEHFWISQTLIPPGRRKKKKKKKEEEEGEEEGEGK